MIPYDEQIIKKSSEEIGSLTAMTPTAGHLFKAREKSVKKFIPEEQVIQFHHNVTKLFFVSTRARQGIQLAVAFQISRVKFPDKDDWENFKLVENI